MYEVELTYRTKMGRLICTFTTAEKVETREDAETVRKALQARPDLASATILVKRTKPLQTSDEAIKNFTKELDKLKPLHPEAA